MLDKELEAYTFPNDYEFFKDLDIYKESNNPQILERIRNTFDRQLKVYKDGKDVYNAFMMSSKILKVISDEIIESPQLILMGDYGSQNVNNLESWERKLDSYKNLRRFMEEILGKHEGSERGQIVGQMVGVMGQVNTQLEMTEGYINDWKRKIKK